MEIFDFINNILFFKKKSIVVNCDDRKKYNSFLVNRWISMSDPNNAKMVNESVNKINFLDNDPELQYKFLVNILPKSNYKKIEYIKKPTLDLEP